MNINKKYEQWLNYEDMDASLKAELAGMTEEQKEDAFYKNLEFGTAGMRGILGAGTNRMNIYTVRKANMGFAKYVANLPEGKERGVAISYDNRHMSYRFAIESAKILAKFGIKSYIMESLRPTPELSFAVRYLKCAGGIMITASHNPKEYNGYKVYDDTGCQLIPEWGDIVVDYVNEIDDELEIEQISDEEAYPFITWVGEEVDEADYKAVMGIEINPGLDKSDFKIVYSPQHGADNIPVRTCLKRLGYDIVPVLAQCAPDPDYTNTKSPNPEVDSSYELAIKLAKEVDADVVAITDPDGDRLGVVDETGKVAAASLRAIAHVVGAFGLGQKAHALLGVAHGEQGRIAATIDEAVVERRVLGLLRVFGEHAERTLLQVGAHVPRVDVGWEVELVGWVHEHVGVGVLALMLVHP